MIGGPDYWMSIRSVAKTPISDPEIVAVCTTRVTAARLSRLINSNTTSELQIWV